VDTNNSKAYTHISSFCKAHLHLQYALKDKAACFTATLVSTCQTAQYRNLQHCNIDHVGSVTMQSLCNSSVSSKDGELITPCFQFLPPFYSLTAMVTGFTCVRFVSDVTIGILMVLMATGFLRSRWSMVSAWRHRIRFCCKGKQMTELT